VREQRGIMLRTESGPGILHQLSGEIAKHRGDISSVEILQLREGEASVYFEIELPGDAGALLAELTALPVVRGADRLATPQSIDGKRVIIMGGDAQVGQVAIGAISEADRHNIRGERISVDTIPLVGEKPLADAVRAQGSLVVSLNMAGSVPDAADLVVTDPVQAGVMTVMAVAETAKFTVDRLARRVF
jgi:energy-converting hydrogenase B subunit Q